MTTPSPATSRKTILDWVEWVGNKLPEPALLFAMLAGIVVIASAIGTWTKWQVQPVQIRVTMVEKVDASGQPVQDVEGKPKLVPKLNEKGKPITTLEPIGAPLKPRSLLTLDGCYWMFSSMIRNFVTLPALGLIFTGMIGIGVAEKFGLFNALMRAIALATPRKLITPMIVFVGANASVASDAGYIILPPLAAALYLAMGRHPIAGLAAAFAGVAGGFGGGMFPTAADGFLAGTATTSAHIIDSTYPAVLATHNLYFKAASAVIICLGGWFVTDRIIEPRLMKQKGLDSQDTSALTDLSLKPAEKKGLTLALITMAVVLGTFAALILIPGAPLSGKGVPRMASGHVPTTQPIRVLTNDGVANATPERTLFTQPRETIKENGEERMIDPGFVVETNGKPTMLERPGDRWSQVIVPMILLVFLIPGMVYGVVIGTLRNQKDFVDAMYHGIRSIVPVLVISFFLGQFVNYFTYTGLDRMLAYAGGSMLVRADMPVPVLITLFILLVIAGDFAMSGMLSKFGVMAPIFIPMFMMVGISPELTTAAYRIGDSVVNVVTPLNSYLLIILAVYQKYKKDAGLGNLMSLMLPYSILFFVLWTGFLLIWYALGAPLGPEAPLTYVPAT